MCCEIKTLKWCNKIIAQRQGLDIKKHKEKKQKYFNEKQNGDAKKLKRT